MFYIPVICYICCQVLTGAENFATAIATRRKLRVVTVATIDLVSLRAELLVDQRHATLVAQEARFMPVLFLVGKVLFVGINRYYLEPNKTNKYIMLGILLAIGLYE